MHLATWLIRFNSSFKNKTTFRKPISVKERLADALCYIVSDDSQQRPSWSNCIVKATISEKIEETTNACGALRDFVPFVQFKKREKHLWRIVIISNVVGLSLQLY